MRMFERIAFLAALALGVGFVPASGLDGIPDSQIKPDPGRARRMFSYAAIYFGDADAQYRLGRLLLSDKGGPRDPRNAARWLKLAAGKDQHAAQAILGDLLFRGTVLP